MLTAEILSQVQVELCSAHRTRTSGRHLPQQLARAATSEEVEEKARQRGGFDISMEVVSETSGELMVT